MTNLTKQWYNDVRAAPESDLNDDDEEETTLFINSSRHNSESSAQNEPLIHWCSCLWCFTVCGEWVFATLKAMFVVLDSVRNSPLYETLHLWRPCLLYYTVCETALNRRFCYTDGHYFADCSILQCIKQRSKINSC